MSVALRLADRVSEARRSRFVGRAAELALFQSALAAEELPFYLLCLFGPGGIGKTTLLREFAHLCDQYAIPTFYLDARNLEPSPEHFLKCLSSAMNLVPGVPAVEVLASSLCRQVILLDTYESLAPLDGWLREVFLPQL